MYIPRAVPKVSTAQSTIPGDVRMPHKGDGIPLGKRRSPADKAANGLPVSDGNTMNARKERWASGNRGGRSDRGFTLLELMIVLAVMGILLAIAQPNLKQAITRAKESVLREDLFQMRDALDQYYADSGKYPAQLLDLVNTSDKSRSYLRDIPKDPFTGAADWVTISLDTEDGGVFDVHSSSTLVAANGTAYNTW